MEALDEVRSPCVVALTWVMQDTLGETLDELEEPVEFLVGGSDLLERIDAALQGHKVGDTLELHLEPNDAFGDYDEMRVFMEPRDLFDADLEEGVLLDETSLPQGTTAQVPTGGFLTVSEIYPEHVVLDGNHPLAGIALRLSLKIVAIRPCRDEELQRGSTGTGFFQLKKQAPDGSLLH